MGIRNWARCAWAVFVKDVRVELRTRHAVGSVALFAVTTLVAVSSVVSGPSARADVKAALLWIVILFAALSGLSRTFVREEEAGTASALRLSAPAAAVYAGKFLFNAALLLLVELIAAPLFLLVLPPPFVNPALLFGVLFLGGLGLASAATFIAAIVAQTASGKSALFTIVAFPVLMPVLMAAANATVGVFDGLPSHIASARAGLGVLAAYAVVMTTASFLLFETIWHE